MVYRYYTVIETDRGRTGGKYGGDSPIEAASKAASRRRIRSVAPDFSESKENGNEKGRKGKKRTSSIPSSSNNNNDRVRIRLKKIGGTPDEIFSFCGEKEEEKEKEEEHQTPRRSTTVNRKKRAVARRPKGGDPKDPKEGKGGKREKKARAPDDEAGRRKRRSGGGEENNTQEKKENVYETQNFLVRYPAYDTKPVHPVCEVYLHSLYATFKKRFVYLMTENELIITKHRGADVEPELTRRMNAVFSTDVLSYLILHNYSITDIPFFSEHPNYEYEIVSDLIGDGVLNRKRIALFRKVLKEMEDESRRLYRLYHAMESKLRSTAYEIEMEDAAYPYPPRVEHEPQQEQRPRKDEIIIRMKTPLSSDNTTPLQQGGRGRGGKRKKKVSPYLTYSCGADFLHVGGGGDGKDEDDDDMSIDAKVWRRVKEVRVKTKIFKHLIKMYNVTNTGDFERSDPADPADFLSKVFVLYYRYLAFDNGNNQSSILPGLKMMLKNRLGIKIELFGSAINTSNKFGSLFYDVERAFGSMGDVFNLDVRRGFYELNPPYENGIIDELFAKLALWLKRSSLSTDLLLPHPLLFYLVLPGRDYAKFSKYEMLEPFVYRTEFIKKEDFPFLRYDRNMLNSKVSPIVDVVVIIAHNGALNPFQQAALDAWDTKDVMVKLREGDSGPRENRENQENQISTATECEDDGGVSPSEQGRRSVCLSGA